MKKLVAITALFASAHLFAQANDYYFISGTIEGVWQDSSGNTVTPPFDGTENLIFDGAKTSAVDMTNTRDNRTTSVADLTFQNINNFTIYNWGGVTMDIGNLNSYNSTGITLFIAPAPGTSQSNAAAINVSGDINVGATGQKSSLYIGQRGNYTDSTGPGPASLTVGGNVNIAALSSFATNVGYNYNDGAGGATSVEIPVEIAGTVNMEAGSQWSVNARVSGGYNIPLDAKVKLGGLNGTDALVRNDCGEGFTGSTTLIFTNTGKAVFDGALANDWSNDKHPSKVKVVMNGAADGVQLIRTRTNVSTPGTPAFGNFSGGVEVISGTLGLYTVANSVGYALVSGGRLAVLGASAEADIYGVIKMDKLTWTGGEIALKVGPGFAGHIELTSFDFSGNYGVFAFDVTEAVESDGTFSEDFLVMSGATFSQEDLDKFVSESIIELSNGTKIDGAIIAFEMRNGTELWASVSGAIPEPAAIAAIMGALAVGLAAWRRRR